jgi:hypothetical protein
MLDDKTEADLGRLMADLKAQEDEHRAFLCKLIFTSKSVTTEAQCRQLRAAVKDVHLDFVRKEPNGTLTVTYAYPDIFNCLKAELSPKEKK